MLEEAQLCPIVIDTNVFVHLLNSQENVKKHISQLLVTLQDTHELQVDKNGKIKAEYVEKLEIAIKNASESGIERYILEIWLNKKAMRFLHRDPPENLKKFVRQIINDDRKPRDRTLVETAALNDCDLITNDGTDILNNATKLKRGLKNMQDVRCRKIRFMTSQDAWNEFCPIN